MERLIDAVVVGGGQAGLAMSHHLRAGGIEHVVLERGHVAETWRSQRWDTFALNTPAAFSVLPGDEAEQAPASAFWPRDDVVRYFDDYAQRRDLPVRTGVTVTSVAAASDGRSFNVGTDALGPLTARSVILANGSQRVPRIPDWAADLPAGVTNLHSADYRNAAALPSGAVLVVGSAQSGAQVAEDLLDAGRTVYLATSRVGRFRRRYRGRDCFVWLEDVGFFAQTPTGLPDPSVMHWPQPVISGTGPLGHSVSLQWLGVRGVRLLGRAEGARGGRIVLRDDLGANIAWGDQHAATVEAQYEDFISSHGVTAGPLEDDPADAPHPDPASVHSPESLDLVDAGISTVIWTTGVTGDFSFLPSAALGADGRPAHTDGVTPTPGLYVLGLPWLRTRASGILPGAGPDAAFIAGRIAERLAAG